LIAAVDEVMTILRTVSLQGEVIPGTSDSHHYIIPSLQHALENSSSTSNSRLNDIWERDSLLTKIYAMCFGHTLWIVGLHGDRARGMQDTNHTLDGFIKCTVL
jgi:hypothetical protein